MQNLYHLRQKLLEEKERLEKSVSEMEEGQLGERFTDSTGDLSAYDQHPADSGLEMFERSKDLALRENERMLLSEVNEALERMDSGRYGVCERCGRNIDPERLKAIPYTTLCLECKEAEEEPLDRQVRPIEEEVMEPPFKRSFRDGEDYAGFDGEDSWQAVARWGTANSPQDVPDAVEQDDAYINADEPIGIVNRVDSIVDVDSEGTGDPEDTYTESDSSKPRRPRRLPLKGTRNP